ncbi:hypothetical protein [Hymenobacter coccineus]|uniref:Uncharacterized protein n=1 Tax=Hymenobacter coccineus TaxID=1908235 RepID=A0A1G1TLL0_9BACT|nr:hypothetical protein [Hymenobacter coccineus]OGX91745.1 hypothetical protein BEN49_18645 [Hymenobacter coccineus]
MKAFAPHLLVALAAAASLAACSPTTTAADSPAASARAAENLLMDRHDSVMAQTGHLFELRQQISTAKPANSGPYVHGLQAADNAMMAWMHGYHAPDTATTPAPARLAYIQQQQTKLEAVEKQMRGTIDSAAALLKQAPGTPAPASK